MAMYRYEISFRPEEPELYDLDEFGCVTESGYVSAPIFIDAVDDLIHYYGSNVMVLKIGAREDVLIDEAIREDLEEGFE